PLTSDIYTLSLHDALPILSRHPQVVDFIEQEVTKLMSKVPPEARVKKFAILHKQFNANDGELTRTLKVRRKFIEDKYRSLIDGIDRKSTRLNSSHVKISYA